MQQNANIKLVLTANEISRWSLALLPDSYAAGYVEYVNSGMKNLRIYTERGSSRPPQMINRSCCCRIGPGSPIMSRKGRGGGFILLLGTARLRSDEEL